MSDILTIKTTSQLKELIASVVTSNSICPIPVGSLYISSQSTAPSTLWSGTTWKQIKDKFILSAGDTYKAGATGGEATHTLTVSEMPSHNHISRLYSANNQNFSMATYGLRVSGVDYYAPGNTTAGSTGGDKCGVSTDTGGSQPHNNMPPYIVYYVWERTA